MKMKSTKKRKVDIIKKLEVGVVIFFWLPACDGYVNSDAVCVEKVARGPAASLGISLLRLLIIGKHLDFRAENSWNDYRNQKHPNARIETGWWFGTCYFSISYQLISWNFMEFHGISQSQLFRALKKTLGSRGRAISGGFPGGSGIQECHGISLMEILEIGFWCCNISSLISNPIQSNLLVKYRSNSYPMNYHRP